MTCRRNEGMRIKTLFAHHARNADNPKRHFISIVLGVMVKEDAMATWIGETGELLA